MRLLSTLALGLLLLVTAPLGHADTNDGRQFAIEAGLEKLDREEDPYVLREQWWEGQIRGGERKVIRQQLFRGNDYWFWAGMSDEQLGVQVHIYDEEGNLCETEAFSRDQVAGSRVVPAKTGTYYIVITAPEDNGAEASEWGLVYAYR